MKFIAKANIFINNIIFRRAFSKKLFKLKKNKFKYSNLVKNEICYD